MVMYFGVVIIVRGLLKFRVLILTQLLSFVFATEKFIQNVTIDGIMMDCTGVERI